MATVRKNTERHRYEVFTDSGQLAGFADYRDEGDVVVLPHTEVERAFEGQGLGSELARAALDDIRASGRMVQPTCSFMRGWIEQHPQYADLVAGD